MASEESPLAKVQPLDFAQDEDSKTLLLYDNIALHDSDGEWVFSKVLATFAPFTDSVTACLARNHFVAQLNIEEIAMLKIDLREKGPEITSLVVEKMVLIWLKSEASDHFKMRTIKLKFEESMRHLERPLWRGRGGPSDPGELLSSAELEAGHASPRFKEFLSSPYNHALYYRLTAIRKSNILCNPLVIHEQHNTRLAVEKEKEANSPTGLMAERYLEEPNSGSLRDIICPSKPLVPESYRTGGFGRPGQSLASYHTAQSSLRGSGSMATNLSSGFYNGSSRRTPTSFQQSPAYYSAKSSLVTNADSITMEAVKSPLSGFLKAVHQKGLVLPPDQELNWSGKENGGQHVEYAKGAKLPFDVIGPIGASLTAQVDKVRCRRILLARKTMLCGRRLTVEEALTEVEHLQNLRHPHIIQLVGSYFQGKRFSVLLYPVADCDLSVFLWEVHDLVQETSDLKTRGATTLEPLPPAIASMWSFFGCLADAIRYIHSTARKHLDIKPGNILVRKHPLATYGYRVYIADFGISRSFKSVDHSQTETHIRRTPKYCAPEVWYQDVHGRAADIFSLGCVYMEMLTVLCGCKCDVEEFAEFRAKDSDIDGAYHETLHRVSDWSIHLRRELEGYYMYDNFFQTFETSRNLVPKVRGLDATLLMLEREPEKRRLPIFNRGEPGEDNCHTCGDVLESFEYAEEV